LTLEKAIRIEELEQELEQKISRVNDLEKKIRHLEDHLILSKISRVGMTPEEEQRYIAAYKDVTKRMAEKGWLVEE
jgi:hypothetical protein